MELLLLDTLIAGALDHESPCQTSNLRKDKVSFRYHCNTDFDVTSIFGLKMRISPTYENVVGLQLTSRAEKRRKQAKCLIVFFFRIIQFFFFPFIEKNSPLSHVEFKVCMAHVTPLNSRIKSPKVGLFS